MSEKLFIIPHNHNISKEARNLQKGHQSKLIWFTGLSGSGKSTIASRVEQLLMERGIHTYILDGDNVRSGLNHGLTFTAEDRFENLRRVAEVSKLFIDAGIVIMAAFISPLEKDREMIRKIVENSNFVEIFVNTSVEECERRDVKGLYKKARKGEISNFTGISAPYEIPKNPDLEISTEGKTVEECAQKVMDYLLNTLKINDYE